jgi:cyanophycinase
VDEKTALLVGSDGVGRLASGSAGSACSLDLKTRTVDHPAAETTDPIEHGVPVTDSIASTIMLRNVVPPDED